MNMTAKQKREFQEGVAYGNTEEGKENAPGTSEGLAFWRGWQWVIGWRKAKDFGDNFHLTTNEDEIPETMRYCALKGSQYRHWTPFVWSTVTSQGDITGLMVDAADGEIVQLWATWSSSPWSNEAVYVPLPVKW